MKKLDEGQKVIAGIILGMGIIIVSTQILLYFANRSTGGSSVTAPSAPAAPAPAGVPGQV